MNKELHYPEDPEEAYGIKWEEIIESEPKRNAANQKQLPANPMAFYGVTEEEFFGKRKEDTQ